jgi:hypothetical protein
LTPRPSLAENPAGLGKEEEMAWKLDGTYFENCSCDFSCPCSISLDSSADNDYCRLLFAFHILSGEVDGVDVSDLGFALVADTPKVMTQGNWRLGVVLDEAASDEQAEKLGAVLSGTQGGPPALLPALIGEMMGIERAPFSWSEDGLEHRVRIGDGLDMGAEDVVSFGTEGPPAQLTNVGHPANSTLTISRSKGSTGSLFGIDFTSDGKSGFSSPFSWAG